MFQPMVAGIFRIFLAGSDGSERADWIVDSAQAEVRPTDALIRMGEQLYAELRDDRPAEVDAPVARATTVRSRNPFSRRRIRHLDLKV